MEYLPTELLSYILSLVDESSWLSSLLTCKLWASVGKVVFDPSVRNNVALRWACRTGRVEVVRELLKDKRVDPTDHGGNAAIRLASAFGYLEIVKLLLEDHRADPSSGLPLCFASLNGQDEVVLELLKDPRAHPSSWKLNRMDDVTRSIYMNVLTNIYTAPRKRRKLKTGFQAL